jgi:hypothetical protein
MVPATDRKPSGTVTPLHVVFDAFEVAVGGGEV